MKILMNKENYIEPDIGTRWIRKGITHNTHFSEEEPFKITNLIPCKMDKGKDRCLGGTNFGDYYDRIRKSLGEETCAGITIRYKYDRSGSACDQCYHTFMEAAERTD